MNIKERNLNFPSFMEKDAQDIVDSLLDIRPFNRVGMQGYDELKRHPYFKGIDFTKLEKRKLTVPSQ
jgi:hypothetical protein